MLEVMAIFSSVLGIFSNSVKGKINEETIRNFQVFMNSKKNSCRGNYMRKYGIFSSMKKS